MKKSNVEKPTPVSIGHSEEKYLHKYVHFILWIGVTLAIAGHTGYRKFICWGQFKTH